MKKEGNKTPLVKAGTIDKLIERTVQEKYPGSCSCSYHK